MCVDVEDLGFRFVHRVYYMGSNNSEGLGLHVAPLKGFPYMAQTSLLCEPINPKIFWFLVWNMRS